MALQRPGAVDSTVSAGAVKSGACTSCTVTENEQVLLLPAADPAESLAILRERRDVLHPEQRGRPTDVNEHFLRHPSNAMLAQFTVYTKDRTPEQTADEIARLLRVS